MIPKIAHLIWLGSNIKFSSIDFIISFFKENPDYQIYIWSDDEKFIKSTLNTRNHGYFSNILVSQRFNIKNIELLKKLSDPVILQSFEAVRREVNGYKINYAAASDILRLMILRKYGGLYLDEDIRFSRVHNPIGQLTSRNSFMIGAWPGFFSNAMLASTVSSQFTFHALSSINNAYLTNRENFPTRLEFINLSHRRSKKDFSILKYTMRLTGPELLISILTKFYPRLWDGDELDDDIKFPYENFGIPPSEAVWKNLFKNTNHDTLK